MNRPPLFKSEYALLAAFAAQMAFMLFQAAFGTWTGDASVLQLLLLILLPFLLAIVAASLIAQRTPTGSLLCILFYLVQVLQYSGSRGAIWSFQFFPTVTIRLAGEKEGSRLELSLFALVMLVVSFVAWKRRGDINESAAAQPATVVEPEVPRGG